MALSGSISGGGFSRDVRGHAPIIDRTVPGEGLGPRGVRPKAQIPPVSSSRHKISVVLVAMVMFGSFMVVIMAYTEDPMASWTPHEPIFISGNDGWESSGFPGSGTEEDRYIIEGLDISGNANEGIFIDSSSVFFKISNVRVTGGTDSVSVGMKFTYADNALVENCVFNDLQSGVWCADSDYATISSSTFTSCVTPVTVKWGSQCDILDNVLEGYSGAYNGIWLDDVSFGDVTGNTISGFDYEGIYCLYAHDCVFSSNIISDCDGPGIFLDWSSGNCVIHDNTLTNNCDPWGRGGGVTLDGCTGILVYRNSFHGNTPSQGFDFGVTGNSWYLEPPVGGNFWDDYAGGDTIDPIGFGDDPYEIANAIGQEDNSQDLYPLITDPLLIPEFTTVVVPVLVVMAMFLFMRRRRST